MPFNNGSPADYLAQSIILFRNDERKGTLMDRIAQGFTDEEIEALTDYFEAKDQ